MTSLLGVCDLTLPLVTCEPMTSMPCNKSKGSVRLGVKREVEEIWTDGNSFP